jgi:hypothetical protein
MDKGHIAKGQIFSGVCPQNYNFNSKVPLLIPVNCVENHRKCKKCKLNFVGFVVKNPIAFVILAELVPDNFSMKNRNVKTLDLSYLKTHKPSVANFWICCVLCHD